MSRSRQHRSHPSSRPMIFKRTNFSRRISPNTTHLTSSSTGTLLLSFLRKSKLASNPLFVFAKRKLKPDARPVENAEDPSGICSAADSRLTVYPTVDLAKKFWYVFSLFRLFNGHLRKIPGLKAAISPYPISSMSPRTLTRRKSSPVPVLLSSGWRLLITIGFILRLMVRSARLFIFRDNIILVSSGNLHLRYCKWLIPVDLNLGYF